MSRIIIPDTKPKSIDSDNTPLYFPDEMHVPKSAKSPIVDETTVDGNRKTFLINNVHNKTWLYFERRDGSFTPIKPESQDYQQFVEYWDIIKRDIKNIRVDILEESVIVTFGMVDGQTRKSELQSLLGKALYSTQNGNNQLIFMIAPDGSGSVQMVEGDKSIAIFTE